MPPFSTGNDVMNRSKNTVPCKALDKIFLLEVINLSSLSHTLISQPVFTCSKWTIETLEQGLKYAQS